MRNKKLMWIAAALVLLILVVSLYNFGSSRIQEKNGTLPELELKIYTDSVDPAARVHAEYFSILGGKPYFIDVGDLNSRMRGFFLHEFTIGFFRNGEGVPQPPILNPKASYESKAGYSIVGNYLSVTRAMTVSDPDSEHPVTTFKAETYNMRDVHLYRLYELLQWDNDAQDVFDQAIAEGKCRLVYPERDIPGAVDVLRTCMADGTWDHGDDYFLTETGVRLFLNERGHENGDYWLFEIAYEDLGEVRASLDVVRKS